MGRDGSRARFDEHGNKLIGLQGQKQNKFSKKASLMGGAPGTKIRYWVYDSQMSEMFGLLELEDYDALKEYLQDIKQMQKIPFYRKKAAEVLGPDVNMEEF